MSNLMFVKALYAQAEKDRMRQRLDGLESAYFRRGVVQCRSKRAFELMICMRRAEKVLNERINHIFI